MYENHFIAILCSLVLGGEPEVSHGYSVGYDLHRIRVDCETQTEVFEVGRDTRTALDSIQQAVFAAELTGKRPVVAIIDTDGREGRYEFRVRTVAERLGIDYRLYHEADLVRMRLGS